MKRRALSSLNRGISWLVTSNTQPPPQPTNSRARGQRRGWRSANQTPIPTKTTPVSSRTSGINRAGIKTSSQRRRSSPSSNKNTSRGNWQRSVKLPQVGPMTALAP